MKLRCRPEDFEVTERTPTLPQASGPFGLYRLTKRGVGTLEALDQVQRAWRLPREALSFGGLKDRHALTRQHVTVQGGPPRDLDLGAVRLEHLGRVDHAFATADLAGNGFRLVLRDMAPRELDLARAAAERLAADGVPSYFDDQRFGSMTRDGEHVAAPWVKGDFEATLRRAFVDANEHDRPRDRRAKDRLRASWGAWGELAALRLPGPARRALDHLAERPGDFEGALAAVRSDLRSLWLAAYQSALWNRWLARLLVAWLPPERRVTLEGKAGPLVLWTRLEPDERERLAALALPLPSARLGAEDVPGGEIGDALATVLAEEGLTLDALDVRGPRGPSFRKGGFSKGGFSKGTRAVMLRPEGLTLAVAPDDLFPGKQALTLAFDLPKGAYATLVVKRLTAVAAVEAGGDPSQQRIRRRARRRGDAPPPATRGEGARGGVSEG